MQSFKQKCLLMENVQRRETEESPKIETEKTTKRTPEKKHGTNNKAEDGSSGDKAHKKHRRSRQTS